MMKMLQPSRILIALALLLFTTCKQGEVKLDNTIEKFQEFRSKEKFLRDDRLFYSGIGNPTLKQLLTKRIDLVACDFQNLAVNGTAEDKDYQNAIMKGLERFSDIYSLIDTEDRERICLYFEELMDIVGLESSGGFLNNFIYGFDPTGK